MNTIYRFYDFLFFGVGMLIILVVCAEIAWRCIAHLMKAKDIFKLFFKFSVDYHRKKRAKYEKENSSSSSR